MCGLFVRHPYIERDRTMWLDQWRRAAWWARHPTTASECMVLRTALLKITTCLSGRTRRSMIATCVTAQRIGSEHFSTVLYFSLILILLGFVLCLDLIFQFRCELMYLNLVEYAN